MTILNVLAETSVLSLVLMTSSANAAALIQPKSLQFTSIAERQSICPVHSSAPATFFCSGTSPTQTTACGNTFNPNEPGVAISTLLISDSVACKL